MTGMVPPPVDVDRPVGAQDQGGDVGVHESVEAASSLAAEGRVRDAITLLSDLNRRNRSGVVERTLVELRHVGFDRTVDPPVEPLPPSADIDLELVDGVPCVDPSHLDLAALRRGLEQYGCLLVRGLLPPGRCRRLVDGIDRAFDALDAWQAKPMAQRDEEATAWFTPFRPVPPYTGRELGGRMFTRNTGGVWTVESPRMMFEVIETFEEVGLGALIADHLSERPVLSAAKCNLRRTPVHIPGGWHQDGSFLGLDASTIDTWVALSECGRDAPGLDVVPHRFDHLLETGLDQVVVPHATVVDAIVDLAVDWVSPEFHPGDVLIFDHMFLHRTAISPDMTRERYALETWFFARSNYPSGQIPLLY